jgi:hypothetical protein
MPLLVLLTNNRSWRHTYPLLKLYYFNASHVGQKTNMGFRYLIDLVNGQWSIVNGEGSASLLLLNYYANSCSKLSVISFHLSIYHWSLSSSTFSVISFQLSIILFLIIEIQPYLIKFAAEYYWWCWLQMKIKPACCLCRNSY